MMGQLSGRGVRDGDRRRLEIEGVLGKTAAQEARGVVARTAQHRAVREPDDGRGAEEECAVRQATERPRRRGVGCPQRKQQLRLEADVREMMKFYAVTASPPLL